MEIKTVNELVAAYPELTTQLINTATTAERKRIQDIENVALPGYEDVINKAKFETPIPAADVAMNIVAEQKKKGAAYLEDMNEDAKNSGANEVNSVTNEETRNKENPYDTAINKVLPETK